MEGPATPINRRVALTLLSAGVLAGKLDAAQQHAHTIKNSPGDYRLQFFSAEESVLIDRVAEMIIPADEHSPGAHAAMVHLYIDLVVANSSAAVQAEWKSQLKAFQDLAASRYGKPFTAIEVGRQAELLGSVSARAGDPSAPAEFFFVQMKKMALAGYYTSKIGLIDELGYQGNQVLPEFPGCQHGPAAHRS